MMTLPPSERLLAAVGHYLDTYAIRDTVLGKMAALRAVADEAETHTAQDYWPFPTYGDLLFGVR